MNASTDQALKSRGIEVKDPKDYIQLGKSESASFKERLSALFSGDEAIPSSEQQSHKIRRKKRAPKRGSNPVLVLVQLGVAFLIHTITGRMLNVNSRWKRRSPPHQLHIGAGRQFTASSAIHPCDAYFKTAVGKSTMATFKLRGGTVF